MIGFRWREGCIGWAEHMYKERCQLGGDGLSKEERKECVWSVVWDKRMFICGAWLRFTKFGLRTL